MKPTREMTGRWLVVVPGFLIGTGLSALLGLMAIDKAGLGLSLMNVVLGFMVCFGPLAGPMAEPLAYTDFDPARMVVASAVLLAMIALHPWRPGILTGIVNGMAIAAWFVWGLCKTYNGV